MTSGQLDLFPAGESWPPGGPARVTPSQGIAAAWLTHAATCGCTSPGCWLSFVPAGFSARTCLGYTASTTAPTSPSCGQASHNSAIGTPSGYWTLNTSESPSGASGSSLPDILQTDGDLSRYCLSPRAAAGILRRAARRGRILPGPLQAALEALAAQQETPIPMSRRR